MRGWLLVLAAMLWAHPAAARELVAVRIDRQDTGTLRALPVHIGGRVLRAPLADGPRGATGFVHEWPGIYWEAAFRGDRVVLAFDDAANEYRLWIDGSAPLTLIAPGRAAYRIDGIGGGPHRLRLEKVTESIGRTGRFDGFHIAPTATPLPVRPRARRIEFIGPSGMTGYGNRSTRRSCTPEEVRLTTDTQQAYPALVAKHYDADYRIHAISGRGLIRNYGGSLPGQGLATVYPYALFTDRVATPDRDWRPQIIVTQLLVDFAGDVRPGEAWPDGPALAVAYLGALERFLADLHRRAPGAAIVVTWLDPATQPDPAIRAMIVEGRRRIEAASKRIGIRHIDFMVQPADLKLALTGCDSHGSLGDHRLLADWTIAYLDRHPEWWR